MKRATPHIMDLSRNYQPMLGEQSHEFGIDFTQDTPRISRAPLINLTIILIATMVGLIAIRISGNNIIWDDDAYQTYFVDVMNYDPDSDGFDHR